MLEFILHSNGVFVRTCVSMCVCANLVAVVDSRCDLSEDASSFCFRQSPPFLDVIVQLSSAGVLHHYHNLIPALEHCTGKHAQAGITQMFIEVCVYKGMPSLYNTKR